MANSVAIVSDAAHMVSDMCSLLLSLVALVLSFIVTFPRIIIYILFLSKITEFRQKAAHCALYIRISQGRDLGRTGWGFVSLDFDR